MKNRYVVLYRPRPRAAWKLVDTLFQSRAAAQAYVDSYGQIGRASCRERV